MRQRHRTTIAFRCLIVVLAIGLGLGCKSPEPTPAPETEPTFRADGVLDFMRADSSIATRIFIEIAESAEAQATGLMYRRSLPERGGMLFIDQEPSMRSFWMKNTPLSLDILFVDSLGSVVNIVKNTAPFSEEHILSTAPAQYVVEVRSGFVDKYRITEDFHITWERRTFPTDS